ncbi:FadR/GntR family transcriptional regulator [Tritonibacter mobilis]|uniref:FadR/GntR family transcriptional regulator n=1 Tax=Tritonibacter mobilis TaxID=379347 RepID=UPI000806ABBE|nr:FCD domain-containing protein [Tritonibacter mobilis]
MALKPATLVQSDLRTAILQGEFSTNGRLPPERVLAEKLAISRTQLRGVLDALAKEGLIFRRHGQGTFLQPPPVQGAERLSALARRVSPRDLMEVRLDLEPALAAHAATRGSTEDKYRLLHLMEDSLMAPDLESYERADDIFHYKIAQMAGNPVFLSLFEEIRTLRQAADWKRTRREALGLEEIGEFSTLHSAIANAICAGSAEAARSAMAEHLQQVSHALRRSDTWLESPEM